MLGTAIAHKRRVGGVALDIADVDELHLAADKMRVELQQHGFALNDVLVERMVETPLAELIVGCKRDPSLGLALLIGEGGSAVEALGNFRLVLLPASTRELEAALGQTLPGLDAPPRQAALQALTAIANLVCEYANRIEEMDINPLILTQKGAAIAADALFVMESAHGQ